LLALPWPISLVGSSTSADCWIIGLVLGRISGFGVLSIVSINGIGSFDNLSLIDLILIGFVCLSFIGGLVASFASSASA
jgi:hypothetical protein